MLILFEGSIDKRISQVFVNGVETPVVNGIYVVGLAMPEKKMLVTINAISPEGKDLAIVLQVNRIAVKAV